MDPTEPQFNAAALVTIDVQRDTLDGGPLEIPGTSAALANIGALCRAFRAAGRPIVHVIRLYAADGSNAEPSRRALVSSDIPVLRPGTPGRLPASELTPEPLADLDDDLLLKGGMQLIGPSEAVMYKPRWGAFYATPLDDHLRHLAIDTIVFAGCNFPNWPRTSIYEASERDYRIVLVTDATSGVYDRGCDELRGIGVWIMTTEEVAARL